MQGVETTIVEVTLPEGRKLRLERRHSGDVVFAGVITGPGLPSPVALSPSSAETAWALTQAGPAGLSGHELRRAFASMQVPANMEDSTLRERVRTLRRLLQDAGCRDVLVGRRGGGWMFWRQGWAINARKLEVQRDDDAEETASADIRFVLVRGNKVKPIEGRSGFGGRHAYGSEQFPNFIEFDDPWISALHFRWRVAMDDEAIDVMDLDSRGGTYVKIAGKSISANRQWVRLPLGGELVAGGSAWEFHLAHETFWSKPIKPTGDFEPPRISDAEMWTMLCRAQDQATSLGRRLGSALRICEWLSCRVIAEGERNRRLGGEGSSIDRGGEAGTLSSTSPWFAGMEWISEAPAQSERDLLRSFVLLHSLTGQVLEPTDPDEWIRSCVVVARLDGETRAHPVTLARILAGGRVVAITLEPGIPPIGDLGDGPLTEGEIQVVSHSTRSEVLRCHQRAATDIGCLLGAEGHDSDERMEFDVLKPG